MKRKNEKVPGFEDIIFENRNKTYGAYDLRKRYNSTTSLSILGGVTLFSMLMIALTFSSEEGTASTGPKSVIIVISDPLISDNVPIPQITPPPELSKTVKYLPPEVVSDTSLVDSFIPTTEVILETLTDGKVSDEVIIAENTDPEIPAETKPFIAVEEAPEYPGGNTALMKFISENINYPADAQNNNIQGKVILKFVVNTDGSADRIEILRSIDPLLDNEAIRVIMTLPHFKPGKQQGVPVPVWFTLPVVFKLENN